MMFIITFSKSVQLFGKLLYVRSILFFLIILQFLSCEYGILQSPLITTNESLLLIRSLRYGSEICTIKPDGSDFNIVAIADRENQDFGGGYHSAQWSPDKNQVVISTTSRRFHASPSLWLMNYHSNYFQQLVFEGSNPHWSAGGNRILFSKWGASSGYFIIDLNSRLETLIAKSSEWWSYSDWSYNGRFILTSEEYDDSDLEIVQVSLSGGEKIRLTHNDVRDIDARWSADESKIAFISGTYRTGYQIKLMNSDGSAEETLVDTLALYNSLCWSPDGKKLAFNMHEKVEDSNDYKQGSDIFILDINRGLMKQITHFNTDSIDVYVQDWK